MNTITPLNQIQAIPPARYLSGLDYFDDVLGGGLVEGSTLILSGAPGAGKSTLVIEAAYRLAESGLKIFYMAGEENKRQIKMRAKRLSINATNIYFSEDTEIAKVIIDIEEVDPQIVIIDSLQMLHTDTLKTPVSSPTQMRYCLQHLCELAKQKGITIIFIGHSTKAGVIAGLQSLQHAVDAVLWLSMNSDKTRTFQAQKNRFGSIETKYILYMTAYGLFDYPEHTTAFGQIKNLNYSEEQIKEIAKTTKWGFFILFSLTWLKEQVKIESEFALATNQTFTLTSNTITSILNKHPFLSIVVKPSLAYIKNYE